VRRHKSSNNNASRVTIAHLTTIDMSLAILLRVELQELVAKGYRTVGLSAAGTAVSELGSWGVEHRSVDGFSRSWAPQRDLLAAVQLFRVLRELKPDVLHTHTPKPGIIGRVVGRLAGVPIVVNTCHGLWLKDSHDRKTRAIIIGIEAIASWFSDAELYQNPDDHRLMRRWLRPGVRNHVVGNGTDLDGFRFDPNARQRIRAQIGLNDDNILILGVGRRVAEKGIRELELAADGLADLPLVKVVWVGPEEEKDLQPTTNNVNYVGVQRNMVEWYSAADIFVLPSYREGLPRSAMEAAACGRPLVLTDIRGCREIGQHEKEVLFVPPADSKGLTSALRRLATDGNLRSTLGSAAMNRAQQVFDQRRVAQNSLAVYSAVVRDRALGIRGRRRRELQEKLPVLQLVEHQRPTDRDHD
jgi:glycosyltransferase involved in cell wall biosynthesis